jgi:hypothetical protein
MLVDGWHRAVETQLEGKEPAQGESGHVHDGCEEPAGNLLRPTARQRKQRHLRVSLEGEFAA